MKTPSFTYTDILGLPIANMRMDEVVEMVGEMARSGNIRQTLFTPNADFLVNAAANPHFHQTLTRADILVADGMPLIWASKYLGTKLVQKISGSSLFMHICEWCHKNKASVYLLGSAEGVAEQAKTRLQEQFPDLKICGTYSPYFGFENDAEENARIISDIEFAKPDILIVGLGSPKQEFWVDRHIHKLNVPVTLGLGASIDFAAGVKKSPPDIVKNLGFGWAWRLIAEPKRLWYRYLVKDMKVWPLLYMQYRNGKTYQQLMRRMKDGSLS